MSGFSFQSILTQKPEELAATLDNLPKQSTVGVIEQNNEILFPESQLPKSEKPLTLKDFEDTAELFAGLINDGVGILNEWVLKLGFGIKDIPKKKKEMVEFEKKYTDFQNRYADFRQKREPSDPQLLLEYQDEKEFYYQANEKYLAAKHYWDEFPTIVDIYENTKLGEKHLKYLSQPIAKYLFETRTRELPPWIDLTIAIGKVYSPAIVNYSMLKDFKQLSANMVDEKEINNQVLLDRINRERDEIYKRYKRQELFEPNQTHQSAENTISVFDSERGRSGDGEKLLDGTDNLEQSAN